MILRVLHNEKKIKLCVIILLFLQTIEYTKENGSG